MMEKINKSKNKNKKFKKNRKPILTSLKDFCNIDEKLIKTKYTLNKPNEEMLKKAFNLLD